MKLVVDISEKDFERVCSIKVSLDGSMQIYKAIREGTSLTPDVLADALMEERIRGKLDSDITFEKDIIEDVKCRLTVNIRDRRPCYCGAELREVWRESEREGKTE